MTPRKMNLYTRLPERRIPPRKYLHSVGDGETVEFDAVEEEKLQRQQTFQALVEFQCKAVNMQQTVPIVDTIHVAGVLHAITSRITRTVRVGRRMRDRRVS